MNTNDNELERKIEAETQNEANEQAAPTCKNGVCELNWQPKRPQAA